MQDIIFLSLNDFRNFHKSIHLINEATKREKSPEKLWDFTLLQLDKLKALKYFNGYLGDFFKHKVNPISDINRVIRDEYKMYTRKENQEDEPYEKNHQRSMLNRYVYQTVDTKELIPYMHIYDKSSNRTQYTYQYEVTTLLGDEKAFNCVQFDVVGKYPLLESELMEFLNTVKELHKIEFTKNLVAQMDITSVLNAVESYTAFEYALKTLHIDKSRSQYGFVLSRTLAPGYDDGLTHSTIFDKLYKSLGSCAMAIHNELEKNKQEMCNKEPNLYRIDELNVLQDTILNRVVIESLKTIKPFNMGFYNQLSKAVKKVKNKNIELANDYLKEDEKAIKM